jgi:hypothetical protein
MTIWTKFTFYLKISQKPWRNLTGMEPVCFLIHAWRYGPAIICI